MKTKIFFLLNTAFAILVFSCNSGNDGTSDKDTFTESGIENKIDTISAHDWDPDFEWDFSCASFTQSELDKIAFLIEIIPENIKDKFYDLFIIWEKAWVIQDHDDPRFNPEVHLASTPISRSLLPEYKTLLDYCKKYNKAIIPLVIDAATKRAWFELNLLADLTFNGVDVNDFIHYIGGLFDLKIDNYIIIAPPGWRSLIDGTVCYCKSLLENEGDNILQAIQDLREAENVAEE